MQKQKMGIPCEVFSRVVGYFRPVQNWNTGKQQEFADRVEFEEGACLNSKVKLNLPEIKVG